MNSIKDTRNTINIDRPENMPDSEWYTFRHTVESTWIAYVERRKYSELIMNIEMSKPPAPITIPAGTEITCTLADYHP